MPFNFGLGIGLPLGGSLFSPVSLFSASEAGFWGEVTPSRLWQDTARTTPVTAAGQSVASWQLNTASGVIYATQSTAGNRPTYQVDAAGRGNLTFNGTSQFLQTPAIDFSATDKMTVIAGVRKLSDAARAFIVDSNNGGTNSFRLEGPNTAAAANYSFAGGGSIVVGVNASSVAAPNTAVISGQGDISGDSAVIRRNGVQAASSAADQGTGNYSNLPLFIGARQGTSAWFSGYLTSLIVRGATTSAAQLAQAETWANARTGAY